MMRLLLVLGLILVPAASALAQQAPSPLSGPNTTIPSPICDLVNFGFCPQPPSPPPLLPDPEADAAAARPVPPPVEGRPHRHHRHHVHRAG